MDKDILNNYDLKYECKCYQYHANNQWVWMDKDILNNYDLKYECKCYQYHANKQWSLDG